MPNRYEFPLLGDADRVPPDTRRRIALYNRWLADEKRPWYKPNLDLYRDYLLEHTDRTPRTVASQLSTIRTRYRELVQTADLHDLLRPYFAGEGDTVQAALNASIAKIRAATWREAGAVRFERIPQVHHLTNGQVNRLLEQPQPQAKAKISKLDIPDTAKRYRMNLLGRAELRDTAILGLLLSAGLSESELVTLQVEDLYHEQDGEWAVRIGDARGDKRLAPVYDDVVFNQRWVQGYIDRWLSETGIEYGPVFRSFRRDGVTLRPGGMTTRSIRAILQSYPVTSAQGEEQTFTPLDLRRTLARRLYLAGIDFETLLSSFGVSSSALLEYIGPPRIAEAEADRLNEAKPKAEDEHAPWNATPMLERLDVSWRRF